MYFIESIIFENFVYVVSRDTPLGNKCEKNLNENGGVRRLSIQKYN